MEQRYQRSRAAAPEVRSGAGGQRSSVIRTAAASMWRTEAEVRQWLEARGISKPRAPSAPAKLSPGLSRTEPDRESWLAVTDKKLAALNAREWDDKRRALGAGR